MKIVFVADQFGLQTPVQQLLDRFLLGYPDGGAFHRPEGQVVLSVPDKNSEVQRRVDDFGLVIEADRARAVADADAVLIFGGSAKAVVAHMRPKARCFVHGTLGGSVIVARELVDIARTKAIGVISGTATRGVFELPRMSKELRCRKALMVVQGAYPDAELEGLEGLLPLIPVRKVITTSFLGPETFWSTLKSDFWPLLTSALSRSDTPQGDPVLDGRTQDLAGLGLLEKLVQQPRGWLVQLEEGLVFVIAVLNGAVAEYNVALQSVNGGIISTQLYRPPAPAQHHYSRLAARLEQFFQSGTLPWPIEQNLLGVELLERFDRSLPSAFRTAYERMSKTGLPSAIKSGRLPTPWISVCGSMPSI